MAPLFSLLLAALMAGGVRAATVEWTGAGDGSTWGDGLNWLPSGVPQDGQDIKIELGAKVILDVPVNQNSIQLGNGVVISTLQIKNTITVSTLTVYSKSQLLFDSNNVLISSQVILSSDVLVSQTGPSPTASVGVRFQVADFELRRGATVYLTGLGFSGGDIIENGFGPGGGAKGDGSRGGGGGGHGSLGGNSGTATEGFGDGGVRYDSQIFPVQAGSGGGGALAPCAGGHGGGLFVLNAVTANIDGYIESNGTDGLDSCAGGAGGGAGGTIFVAADYVLGRATMTANGGVGGQAISIGGGGGAGGRIAVHIKQDVDAFYTMTVDGGDVSQITPVPGGVGDAGTTYIDPKIYTGNSGGNCSTPSNWFSHLTPQANENVLFGSSNPLTGCTWNIDLFSNSLGSFTISSAFQGVIDWKSTTSIGGNFNIAGGTLTSQAFSIKVGGDWNHTGGVFQLEQGTVTFSGAEPQTVSQLAGSFFNDFEVANGTTPVTPSSDLLIKGNLTLGDRFTNAASALEMRIRGGIFGTPPAAQGNTSWVLDGTVLQAISTGPYYALTVNNSSGVTVAQTTPARVGLGGLTLSSTALLTLTNQELQVEGSFTDLGGTFTVTGATLAFVSSTGTVYLSAPGMIFDHVSVVKPSGTLVWQTSATIKGNMAISSGATLSLINGSTLALRGDWRVIEGGVFDPGSGAVFLSGASPQVVFSSAAGRFNNLISSNPATVTLSTHMVIGGNLEKHAGNLDFTGIKLSVRGDFRDRGGGSIITSRSTMTFDGSGGAQTIDLGTLGAFLDSVVISNTNGGVLLRSSVTIGRDFEVQSGAIFNGRDKQLSMTGNNAVWKTVGADYRSDGGGQHVLVWTPLGGNKTLFITGGSTLNAQVNARGALTLQGALYLNGGGNNFYGDPGLVLDARSSTITLNDTTDLSFPADGAYIRDKDSWIVFAGSGSGRGASLSTGPFQNIGFRPDVSSATLVLNDLFLDGSFLVEGGTVVNNGNATLDISENLLLQGGALAFAGSSTGTVRFTGTSTQTVLTGGGDTFGRFQVAASSMVRLSGSALRVAQSLALSSGVLAGGSARIEVERLWTGNGGVFSAEMSTVAFVQASTAVATDFLDRFTVGFNGLSVQASTIVFRSSFTAAVLTSTRPGSLLTFAPIGSGSYVIDDLRISSAPLNERIRLRSLTPGTRFDLNVVTASTVTAVDLQDAAASGIVLHVNDGDSVDSGNNDTSKWNFKPFLVLEAPGETYTENAGKSGTPTVQVAGTPFTVTVTAVSDRFRTRTDAGFLMGVRTADPYDAEPASQTLTSGKAVFSVVLRVAEPAPLASVIALESDQVFLTTATTVSLNPGGFDRLQLVLPGEQTVPGLEAGRTGLPGIQVKNQAFTAVVRATDQFWNLVTGITDTVALSSASVSTVTLPSPAALSGGVLTFTDIVFHATGTFQLRASDLTNVTISSDVSLSIQVFGVSTSSPDVKLGIPLGAVVPTLGSAIVGTASDEVAVAEVRVAIEDSAAGLFFDWNGLTFSSAVPHFERAVRSPPNSADIVWTLTFPDYRLSSGKDYFIVVESSNASQLVTRLESTFTYDTGGLAFHPDDGQGIAEVYPYEESSCQILTSSIGFTVGAGGIGAGGALAVRLPEGWTKPTRFTGGVPALGEVGINSTSPAYPGSVTRALNPASYGDTLLGDNWILVAVGTNPASTFSPGETLTFEFSAYPPNGAAAVGKHVYDIRVQGKSGGSLVSLSSAPTVVLREGPPAALRFREYGPITLGPLQRSPTMQLEVTDACGNPAAVTSNTGASLSAVVPIAGVDELDRSAQFFNASGAPITQVSVLSGQAQSASFRYETSTGGVSFELVRATITLTDNVRADRPVTLKVSSVALSEVSIDTGSLITGATSALIAPGSPAARLALGNPGVIGARAVVRFRLTDPQISWEVAVSTSKSSVDPVFTAAGFGDPDRVIQVPFDGIVCGPLICGILPPGHYPIRIRAAGGVIDKRALEVVIADSGEISGTMSSSGIGAVVTVEGPGAGYGNAGVVDSTGAFRIYGLQAGSTYTVRASSEIFSFGESVRVSTEAAGIVPPATGVALTLHLPSFIRVNVGIPAKSPADFYGGVLARNKDSTQRAGGTLHFSSGTSRSDNGLAALSLPSSTWTVLSLPPGTYDLDIDLERIGLSSRIVNVSLSAGQVIDIPVQLKKRSNIHGSVLLAPTRHPAGKVSSVDLGAAISVRALQLGATVPTVFGGAFVTASSGASISSAPYGLYGLTAGTWTLTASGDGFLAVSTTILVLPGTDIGDPVTGVDNLDLTLSSGSAITGAVTLLGDTSDLHDQRTADGPLANTFGSSFTVRVTAYNRATYRETTVLLLVSTHAAVTSSTFTMTGLEPGRYQLRAFRGGFEMDPGGAVEVDLSTAAEVSLALSAQSGHALFDIYLPAKAQGACHVSDDYRGTGFFLEGPGRPAEVFADITTYDDSVTGAVEELQCRSMKLRVPGLGTGLYNFKFMHADSGNAQDLFVPVTNRSTAPVGVDLARSTYTVSGSVTLSGSLKLDQNGFTVTISSVPGLVAQSSSTAYCLMSSSRPVTLSAARVELVPLDMRTGRPPGELLIASSASCAQYEVEPSSANPPALIAYTSAISTSGAYSISGVPAGAYLLRTTSNLDEDAGNEVARVQRILRVSSDTTAAIEIVNGISVSGGVLLPPGISITRPVSIAIADDQGRVVQSKTLNFNRDNTRPYVFEQMPAGKYTVSVRDQGSPAAFAARPVSLLLEGSDLPGTDIRLERAGRIQGRIAIERALADGAREYLLITRDNRQLLSDSLKIVAVPDPWLPGGLAEAQGEGCGLDGCARVEIDEGGYFNIPRVLPGRYDVEFNVVGDENQPEEGRFSLVSSKQSGVVVDEGATTALGSVRLLAGSLLTGRVTLAGSTETLSGVRILARPSTRGSRSPGVRRSDPEARTGPDGMYELRGLDPFLRYYTIIAGEREEGRQDRERAPYEKREFTSVDIRSTTTLDMQLVAAGFGVSGKIVSSGGGSLSFDDEGRTRPGARFYLQRGGVMPTLNPLGDIIGRTDLDGNFALSGLGPGSYKLTASALGHSPRGTAFVLGTSSASLGTLTLDPGAVLSGAILHPDGSGPGEDEIEVVIGATADQTDILLGTLTKDPITRSITGYRISGFRRDIPYRIVLLTPSQDLVTPDEGTFVLFTSTGEARTLDLSFRRRAPFVLAKSRLTDGTFVLKFQTSHPLRVRKDADDDLALILSTFSAQGSLTGRILSDDRTRLEAVYTPSVNESSFTLLFSAYSSLQDPDSNDAANPEFLVRSTFSFFAGLDGYHRGSIPNLLGGSLAIEGDGGRVDLPEGVFFVGPSSAVLVTLQRSKELLTDANRFAASGVHPTEANLRALRHGGAAYPPGLLSAIAATPPSLSPESSFYDILIPAGVRTALAEPVELTLSYSAGVDPDSLHLYWYNPKANAYILQQDVTGRAPVLDRTARTFKIHINHFSTFVLFETGVSVISGNTFGGGEIEAYNFPNPFDLKVKTVTPIHGIAAQTVRGTMIRVALPADVSGPGSLHIFNMQGQRVRTLDLGSLRGGQSYYQPWDGRNDNGRDVASGVYFGQVKFGSAFKFFKMAVIK